MSRPGTVSRADLLRLLAACPDAPLATAAQLAGWPSQPESPVAVQVEVTEDYETAPAAVRLSPQERFWQLRSRELLSSRSNRAQALLPAELRQLRPLREKELRRSVSSPSVPHSRQATALLQAAVRQQPLRFALVENHPEPAPASVLLAQELLRSGVPLDRNQTEWLDHFLLRLVRTWFDRRKDADLLACARDLLDLLPEDFRKRHDSVALLYGLAQRDALRKGAIIPSKYRPEAVLATAQEPLPPSTWLLLQEGEALFLLNSPDSGICLLKGSRLAALTLDSDMLLLRRNGQTITAPVQTLLPLALLNGLEQLAVQSRTERLHLQTCVRPTWAVLIGRNSRELFAEVPWLGRAWRLRWQVPAAGTGGWSSGHGPVCADRFGISAYIGFYGRVMQRFRWLEPGRFWMGSPPDEPEREAWGKETQHEVTLSKGFWLADTTISQELWQFVMRSNPSRFLGRELPVDSVSWEDAQLFLQRLNAMVPGLAARLPTEAEWEYACRAGTATPFTFGSQISSEQVNCNASCPYHGSAKGLFRRQTVAVGSLPANAWGLHEMHGNLWEWCQDWWQEDLGGDAALDPHGPQQGEFRVARGGSWFLSGRAVRSAVRGRFAPNFRNDRLGFRIARDHELRPADTAAAAVSETTPAAPPSFLRRLFGQG